MAVKLATEYQILFTVDRENTSGGPVPLGKDEMRFPSILHRLPIPENYRYPHLTRLSNAYLQHLNA